MNIEEKINRIMNKANISYEEAKGILEQTNGDMLDAIIILERQGKVKGTGQSIYTTQQEEKNYIDVKAKIEEQSTENLGESLERLFRTIIRFIRKTNFIVKKRKKRYHNNTNNCFCYYFNYVMGSTSPNHVNFLII